jgi:chromosome partitioning protein
MNDAAKAKIISVFNEKGGSGKTTTACQLAGTLGIRGYDVLVADLDPQQTSASWLARKGGANFAATIWPGFRYEGGIALELGKLASKYDVIVIDCAPSVKQEGTWAALLVSDMALIPTKLGPSDTDALPAAMKLTKTAWKTLGRQFPVFVVPVAHRKNRQDERTALELLSHDDEFPLCPFSLGDRVPFTRSMVYGATAHALPHSKEAVNEIEGLASFVCEQLSLEKKA